MSLVVRLARPDEIPRIQELRHVVFYQTPGPANLTGIRDDTTPGMLIDRTDGEGIHIVAVQDNATMVEKIVGAASVALKGADMLRKADQWYLDKLASMLGVELNDPKMLGEAGRLFVLPDYRGRGIGRQLQIVREAEFVQRGGRVLISAVHRDNALVQGLKQGQGWIHYADNPPEDFPFGYWAKKVG